MPRRGQGAAPCADRSLPVDVVTATCGNSTSRDPVNRERGVEDQIQLTDPAGEVSGEAHELAIPTPKVSTQEVGNLTSSRSSPASATARSSRPTRSSARRDRLASDREPSRLRRDRRGARAAADPRSTRMPTSLDMNPLIDVCLVLLVFFILTTATRSPCSKVIPLEGRPGRGQRSPRPDRRWTRRRSESGRGRGAGGPGAPGVASRDHPRDVVDRRRETSTRAKLTAALKRIHARRRPQDRDAAQGSRDRLGDGRRTADASGRHSQRHPPHFAKTVRSKRHCRGATGRAWRYRTAPDRSPPARQRRRGGGSRTMGSVNLGDVAVAVDREICFSASAIFCSRDLSARTGSTAAAAACRAARDPEDRLLVKFVHITEVFELVEVGLLSGTGRRLRSWIKWSSFRGVT